MKMNYESIHQLITVKYIIIILCSLDHKALARRRFTLDEIFAGTQKSRTSAVNYINPLDGRADVDGRSDPDRLPLPRDVLNYKMPLDSLECGTSYSIKDEGYLTFKLDSPRYPCEYFFLGTKVDNCTTVVMCKGNVHFTPATDEGCVDEFFAIKDGLEGRMSSCGSFTFDDRPRVARDGGSDIYMCYKGAAPGATCVVFCLQDVKHRSSKITRLKLISRNKSYKGLPTEPSCTCGKRNDRGRVVGGDNAKKFEFPWLGAVVFNRKGYERQPFCGASLINDRYAITAAHCFSMGITAREVQLVFHAHIMDKRVSGGFRKEDPMFRVIPGWNLPKETDESEHSVRADVDNIILHPKFNEFFDYDIAIIKLQTRINLKKGMVYPICLPELNQTYDFGKELMTVAGWGRFQESMPAGVRILQKLDLPYTELSECRTFNPATYRHICSGYIEGGRDACSGDSGGPLIHKFKGANQYLLAGVVSAGRGCARVNNLGLYTNVQEVLQWIHINTEEAEWCKR